MKFVKSAFLSVVFACVGLMVGTNVAVGADCTQSPAAGKYCKTAGTKPDCSPGCWCQGGIKTEVGVSATDPAKHVEDRCSDKRPDYKDYLAARGVNYCPDPFTSSLEGASAETQCYMSCNNRDLHNIDVYCDPGRYLLYGKESCEDCPAGYACAGGSYHTYCNGDIPGREQCSGLNYAVANSSACSPCDGAGQRIFKSGVLNIDCQTCPDGKYALADHSDCADCPVGYSCQGGIQNKCTGNTYSDVQGLADCKVCSGDKMGVKYTTTTVNDQTETLQTGCGICPDGQYSDSGICKPCELGHYCVNGTKTPCAKGYYAATRSRTSCSPCGTNYTTEGTGSTSASACVFDGIRLKTTSSTEIKFPACLSQGDVNTSVIR